MFWRVPCKIPESSGSSNSHRHKYINTTSLDFDIKMMTRGVVGGHDCKLVKFGHDPSSWALSPPFCVCSDLLLQCFSFSQRKHSIKQRLNIAVHCVPWKVSNILRIHLSELCCFVPIFSLILWHGSLLSVTIHWKSKKIKSYHLHNCICLSKEAFHFIKKRFWAILKHLCSSIYS